MHVVIIWQADACFTVGAIHYVVYGRLMHALLYSTGCYTLDGQAARIRGAWVLYTTCMLYCGCYTLDGQAARSLLIHHLLPVAARLCVTSDSTSEHRF